MATTPSASTRRPQTWVAKRLEEARDGGSETAEGVLPKRAPVREAGPGGGSLGSSSKPALLRLDCVVPAPLLPAPSLTPPCRPPKLHVPVPFPPRTPTARYFMHPEFQSLYTPKAARLSPPPGDSHCPYFMHPELQSLYTATAARPVPSPTGATVPLPHSVCAF